MNELPACTFPVLLVPLMVGMLRLILLGFRQDRKDKEKDKVGGVGSGNPAWGGGGTGLTAAC